MKRMKKLMALVIAVAMVLAMGMSVMAATQTVPKDPADADNATITVNNPAKGETYKVFKLFDATVGGDADSGYTIAYQGVVPEGLANFFEADAQGNITPKESIVEKDDEGNVIGTIMTDELKAALETWAGSASAVNQAESDGSEALAFTGLPYGYYVVTTTHKPDGEAAKAAITVTSTKPNASIYDKNANEPTAKKEVEKESYSIGDTVKYTATFDTTNYMGEGANAKQVVDYVISDTLPAYLSDVTVKSITIGGQAATVQQFDAEKKIVIPWATKDETADPDRFTSLYDQGAKIVIVYEAKLTSTTNINAADTNTITITPEVDNDQGDKEPWEKSWSDNAEITTYAAALKKTDGSKALAGAEFTIAGLQATETEAGVYTVVSYDPSSTATPTTLKTDANGKLYIVGLAKGLTLKVTETKAPEGYNKMDGTKDLTPQVLAKQLYKTSGYEKYDKDGNLIDFKTEETTEYIQVTKNLNELDAAALEIVNEQGPELPTTGGIGTTIFYIVGAILVVGGGILLVSRRRMSSN